MKLVNFELLLISKINFDIKIKAFKLIKKFITLNLPFNIWINTLNFCNNLIRRI